MFLGNFRQSKLRYDKIMIFSRSFSTSFSKSWIWIVQKYDFVIMGPVIIKALDRLDSNLSSALVIM